MNKQYFISHVMDKLPVGTVLNNPSKGTSVVKSYTEKNIYYVRGISTISVGYSELYDAYRHFKGKVVSASDLKRYNPHVFDSQGKQPGHSCNCTFLFLILGELGLIDGVHGQGVRGNPYYVKIPR